MNETEAHPANPLPGATSNAPSVEVKRKRAPSLKRAQTKVAKETTRGFPLPLVLTCPVTGKISRYTSLAYIRKLIAKYGTIEAIKENYISSEGRKLKTPNA